MLILPQTIDSHIRDIGIKNARRLDFGWTGIIYSGTYLGDKVAIKYSLSRVGHTKLNSNNAIKIDVPNQGIINYNEIYIMTQMKHNNLMSAMKVMTFKDNKLLCGSVIIMKYAPNSLMGYPVSNKIGLIIKIASAIDYLHHNNISHRDINPSNILIMNDEPYLADFSNSRFDSDDHTIDIELFGQLILYVFLGTSTYLKLHVMKCSNSEKKYKEITLKLVSSIDDDILRDLLKSMLI